MEWRRRRIGRDKRGRGAERERETSGRGRKHDKTRRVAGSACEI